MEATCIKQERHNLSSGSEEKISTSKTKHITKMYAFTLLVSLLLFQIFTFVRSFREWSVQATPHRYWQLLADAAAAKAEREKERECWAAQNGQNVVLSKDVMTRWQNTWTRRECSGMSKSSSQRCELGHKAEPVTNGKNRERERERKRDHNCFQSVLVAKWHHVC